MILYSKIKVQTYVNIPGQIVMRDAQKIEKVSPSHLKLHLSVESYYHVHTHQKG
jgi:hypothetical protein